MADKEKRSLREFLRHINDYTYRFDPERGRFRYRELRGVRDTAFDFYMWLKCWKDMVVFVAKCPVSAGRARFRYQWFATYLTYPNFVDRGTLGMRGNQLRMARAQYDRIVKKATDLLRISFVADEHFHPGNKLSKKVVLFDELVPGEIMAGFPNLIYLPAQVLPVFLCSILDQQITPPYLDAAENFGIPADVWLAAGFTERIEGDGCIIPNYLTPPLHENTEYYYFTNKPENFVMFKADGDQDRPNLK